MYSTERRATAGLPDTKSFKPSRPEQATCDGDTDIDRFVGIGHDPALHEIDEHVGHDARMNAEVAMTKEGPTDGNGETADAELHRSLVGHDRGNLLGHGHFDRRGLRVGHQDFVIIGRDEEVDVRSLNQGILPGERQSIVQLCDDAARRLDERGRVVCDDTQRVLAGDCGRTNADQDDIDVDGAGAQQFRNRGDMNWRHIQHAFRCQTSVAAGPVESLHDKTIAAVGSQRVARSDAYEQPDRWQIVTFRYQPARESAWLTGPLWPCDDISFGQDGREIEDRATRQIAHRLGVKGRARRDEVHV